ncbi:MAG TPA: SulP family inorganic anion transporter, partial [bacterium]|nr:SulP family inorganic anion transporter [bacterium]
VADGMIGDRHRSNMELIAQGLANIVTPFFGGIPATGVIARTATNIRNGGRTPIAGIIHALILLMILLIFGKWAALIPLPCLAAILIYVAYNMSEHTAFMAIIRGPRTDVIVLLTTFVLTVLVDLTVAIEIGMILAAFLFMKQMADVTHIQVIKSDLDDHDEPPDTQAIKDKRIPQGVQVFEINGPFFFGSVYKFQEHFDFARRHTRVLILRMRAVPYVDAGGLHALREMMNHCRKDKVYFLIAEIHTQPLIAVEQSGLMQTMGEDYYFGNLDEALAAAGELIKSQPAENTESLHRYMHEIREGQK